MKVLNNFLLSIHLIFSIILNINQSNVSSSSSASSSISEKYLDRIVIVIRHGDRAPLFPYEFDSKKSSSNQLWPLGYGYLSELGRQRMYHIGRFLRRRYSKQFDGHYITPRDVYIRSSAVPRCLESAQLIAAGMLPPSNVWNWNSDIGNLWQPVPIYTIQRWRDGLLNPSSTCLYADKLYNRILQSQIVRNFLLLHQELLQNVSCITNEKLNNHREIRDFVDNLLSRKHHGYRLPKWCTVDVYKKLKQIFDHSFRFDFTGIIEPELRRLRSGVLMNEIFNTLDVDAHPNMSRLSIFVTHDSQLFHLIDALGINVDQLSLNFGSMLIFEHRKPLDQLILYHSNVPGTMDRIRLNELKIPICPQKQHVQQSMNQTIATSETVPLKFIKMKHDHLLMDLDQWDYECGNSRNYVKQQHD